MAFPSAASAPPGSSAAADASSSAVAAQHGPIDAPGIIPDRGEFIDVLRALRRGHVLVHAGDHAGGWVVDGGAVYSSYDTLVRYELVREYENPAGFEHVHYFRLTPRGRDFADRAVAAWRQRPILERMMVRLVG
ncbi:MAG: hypothetical protein IT499_16345 [Rubrivivax sp.]|nr:hypothetical protein [Rubrivivax sp.]MCL4698571.1 hypothetical protein [Burkholderiaceae bacterium]